MKDRISIERISKLHPKVRDTFTRFIDTAEAELGITLRVTQGLRTIAEQNALYAQGRTAPGKIVTNARGGSSYHNFGLSIDVAELQGTAINWNFDYKKLAPIAASMGIEWGGLFHSIIDKPHFQITFGYSTQKLLLMPKDASGYVVMPNAVV